MDISFENRDLTIYTEYSHQTKRIQESAECVVPDTDADIDKIAGVMSEIYLKSKDLSARGVLISGEVSASVFYITDKKESVSSLTIRKPFSVEYEVDAPESETLAQITLLIQGTDIRLVNPRKIAAGFEIEGDLSCYHSEKLRVESRLPENAPGLHARVEEQELTLPNAVCEKSVSINEQFPFPAGAALPVKLAGGKAELLVSDCQLIGTKVIVKGTAELRVCTFSEETGLPAAHSFSAPFSQIIDIGAESMSFCTVKPEVTGAYYDLVDTINGERALDMEVHAVLQIVCSERQKILCITDAYSNLMPADLLSRTQEYRESTPVQTLELSKEEQLGLMEPCSELLHVVSSVSRVSADAGKLSVSVTLDFLYRNAEGALSAGRRTLTLTKELEGEELHILHIRALRVDARAEGETVNCSVTLIVCYCVTEKRELSMVDGVILNEEAVYIQESLPTLTLVRAEGESLWTLAKRYHSSEEMILKMNENIENAKHMLLIPKCI